MSSTDAPSSFLMSHLPPALAAVLAHLPGLALAAALLAADISVPTLPLAILVGMTAAATATFLALPVWWRVINLLFVPMICLMQQAELDARWYLGGFLLLAVTSLGTIRTRVPLFLSSARAAMELARRLPEDGSLCDLGCGLGGPLARVAKARPDAQLVGVEAAPLNWLISRMRLPRRAEIRLGSLWDMDLSRFDVVYAYLSPAPMARLWEKASREMKPGSLFISNSFAVPGLRFDEVIELDDLAHSRLLIRRVR